MICFVTPMGLCSGCHRLAGTHVTCFLICRPYGTVCGIPMSYFGRGLHHLPQKLSPLRGSQIPKGWQQIGGAKLPYIIPNMVHLSQKSSLHHFLDFIIYQHRHKTGSRTTIQRLYTKYHVVALTFAIRGKRNDQKVSVRNHRPTVLLTR